MTWIALGLVALWLLWPQYVKWKKRQKPREHTSAGSFVLGDGRRTVDVHVFAYDGSGKHVYGIAYPFGSLTGTGEIDGVQVSCIAPQWMFRFKTAYAPTAKDIADVSALAERFGFAIPDTHKPGALRSPA